MGSSLFEMMTRAIEGRFIGVRVDIVGWKEGWDTLFSHKTAFDLLDDVVSCHRGWIEGGKGEEEKGVVYVLMGLNDERKG